ASAACFGARRDGIDPATVTDPTAAQGGANIVTKIDMNSDLAVVRADFGLTTARSWGDAPDSYQTTAQAGGPSAAAGWLSLGTAYAVYPDGAPGPDASEHDATDDGLTWAAPAAQGGAPAAADFLPAQGRLLAAGGQYYFSAAVAGPLAPGATAKVWITPLTSQGSAATSWTEQLLSHTYGQETSHSAAYQVPATAPASGLASVYARARVDRRSDFAAAATALTDQSAQAWTGLGEVEDYRLAIANGVVRLRARTLGDLAANVNVSLGNVLSGTPSSSSNSVLTKADSDAPAVWFPADHAVADLGGAVSVTTTGVGRAEAADLGGWGLAAATNCRDTLTGAVVEVDLTASAVTIPSGRMAGWTDLTCELVYGAAVSQTVSSLTVSPTPSATSALAADGPKYTARVEGKGVVTAADGSQTTVVVPGGQAKLALANEAGQPTTGVKFADSSQSYTCQLDQDGVCQVEIGGSLAGAYRLTASTPEGALFGQAILHFGAGGVSQATSRASITDSAGQLANHDLPGTSAATWGTQTITVELRDANRNPVTDAAGRLSAALEPSDAHQAKIYYGNGGVFQCSVALQGAVCPSGNYVLDVYSAKAGERRLSAAIDAGQVGGFTIQPAAPASGPALLTHYATPPVSAGHSTLVVSPSTPADDPDNPADEPDGVPNQLTTGQPYEVRVTTWDYARNNRVGAVPVELSLTGATCQAQFSTGGAAYAGPTSAAGQLRLTVASDQDGSCTLAATVSGTALAGSGKTLTWVDDTVDPDNPQTWFTVSTEEVVADGKASGTITVQLLGYNKLPVTTAATRLSANGPLDGGVAVGPFTHQGGGIYTAQFSGAKSGDKLINALLASLTLPSTSTALQVKPDGGNQTAHFIAGPVHLPSSWLIEPAGTAVANGTASLTVGARLRDQNQNPIPDQEVWFAIPSGVRAGAFEGPAAVRAITDATGLARLALTSEASVTAETPYVVTATTANAEGAAVAIANVRNAAEAALMRENGQLHLVFRPGPPAPGASRLSIPSAPAEKTVASEFHTPKAELFDATGNPYTEPAAVVFYYKLASESAWVQGPTLTAQGGSVTWDALTVTKAGLYDVKAEVAGSQIGTTQQCAFKARPVDPAATLASLWVSQVPVAANGIASVPARMVAQDEYGNVIQGVSLGFALLQAATEGAAFGAPGGGQSATATSGANGVAEVQIVSLYAGAFPVQGSLGAAVSAPPHPNANFSNDVPDPDQSEFQVARTSTNASPTKAIADGADSYTATIKLRNAGGVLINGVGGTLYFRPVGLAGASERTFPFITGVDGAGAGLAEVVLTTLKSGLYEVSVKIGDDPVATEPGGEVLTVAVEFEPGPVDIPLTRATFQASTGKVLSDDVATHSAQVTVKDANENLIAGQTVVFSLDPAKRAHFVDPVSKADLGQTLELASSQAGLAAVLVSSPVPEVTHLSAAIGAASVGEVDFQFATDAPSAAASSWAITPADTRLADGVEYFTATVTIRDSSPAHLLVAGAAVDFEIPAGVAISPLGPYLTNADGQVAVQL
ncbi:MAG: Ig-like domain-containing protein, partial [Bifidobacteriaceae bacterium]|nr:Ig-like domain-containing protein [Bifidobacteriaceae bacterium]